MEHEKGSPQILLKLVFAGKHGAGKTSLLTRQSTDQFTQKWVATIGVDFRIKRYNVGNFMVKAQLWDTAGQERFRSIQRPYYKGAHGVLLCFDLSDRSSFQSLQKEIQDIRGLDMNTIKIYLIGCKSDKEPQVFTDEILIFSQTRQCVYFQTSAKINEGVNQCFQAIVQQSARDQIEKLAIQNLQNKSAARQLAMNSKPNTGRKFTCC